MSDFFSYWAIMAAPFVLLYLVIKSRVFEKRKFCQFILGVFALYAVVLWIEVGFVNAFIEEKHTFYGLVKLMSIMQLPMIFVFIQIYRQSFKISIDRKSEK